MYPPLDPEDEPTPEPQTVTEPRTGRFNRAGLVVTSGSEGKASGAAHRAAASILALALATGHPADAREPLEIIPEQAQEETVSTLAYRIVEVVIPAEARRTCEARRRYAPSRSRFRRRDRASAARLGPRRRDRLTGPVS